MTGESRQDGDVGEDGRRQDDEIRAGDAREIVAGIERHDGNRRPRGGRGPGDRAPDQPDADDGDSIKRGFRGHRALRTEQSALPTAR
jgi:hypothetical protein